MNDMSQIKSIPLVKGMNRPFLDDVATFSVDSVPGEYDRSGPRRFVTVSANINKCDLGRATDAVQKSLLKSVNFQRLQMQIKGMSSLLLETFSSLQTGLLTALIVILLLLAANYQSFKLSLIVLSTRLLFLLGALLFLLATGSTLNLQSYMG